MRAVYPVAMLILAACADADQRRDEPAPLTAGEERTVVTHSRQTASVMRTGPRVPLHLPPGFTLFPAAEVLANTLVDAGGERRSLVVFATPASVEDVSAFYRDQARAARVRLQLDIGGADRASLGGTLAGGGTVVIAMRREGGRTRVELAAE